MGFGWFFGGVRPCLDRLEFVGRAGGGGGSRERAGRRAWRLCEFGDEWMFEQLARWRSQLNINYAK